MSVERKTQRALGLVAPIYVGYPEGFDTADLKEAKAFLEQIEC